MLGRGTFDLEATILAPCPVTSYFKDPNSSLPATALYART